MATGPKGVCRELKTLFHLGVVGTLSDAQLLEEFLARSDDAAEDAFAAVVERHGPMVLRVCRRILTEPHDAEDAFQVTFLVLARKARLIARREQLTNWLYGVAVRTAKEVRKSSARRRAREGRVDEMVRTASSREEDVDELRLVIDDELSRLPESFRAPVVLCDLEGKTQKEAAQLLGVPVGTVSSRLSRGRNLLRERLTRRGLAPPGTELATEPFRDETPAVVPPALVACTSRAAAQFAIQGTLAGTVAAHLATITEGVLKAMLIAKLTSNTLVVSAILFLSIGAAAVGVVTYARLGAEPTIGPDQFASGRTSEDDWSWIDKFKNADRATKERLKRCARSANENFAAIRRLIFDYDLGTEAAQLPLDATGKMKGVDRGFSHGTVYWRDGSVRYDHFPDGELGPNGQRFIFKRPKAFSVVRSRDMLAYTEPNGVWGLFLTVVKPPQAAEEWEHQSHAPQRRLDPWLHYAEPFCSNGKKMREIWENCRAIESEEEGGKVLLRFILNNINNGRAEVTCDQSAEWLPVRIRGGDVRDGKWIVFVDQSTEWKMFSGVWYPSHQVKTAYYGSDLKPVKEFDLNVRNLRANGAANVPESVFSLSAMHIPDGTKGLDRRYDPFRWLIRAGGVVRAPRPGEGPAPRNVEEEKIERQKDWETVPVGEATAPALKTAAPGSPDAAESLVPKQEYLSLLEQYESACREAEKAFLEAKTEQGQRAAFPAFGRLEWTYAGRFLALARKYPQDPVAIDALGALVASRFTPPEAERAADILIRDHIKNDKLIPIYRTSSSAWSTAGERLLRAGVDNGPTPEARGQACLSLGYLLVNRAGDLRRLRGPEPLPFMKLEELLRSGGREPVKRSVEDPDALSKEAEQFFDRVVEQYAGIAGKSGKLGEAAEKELFRLRQLAVGRPAPDVEGEDVDGKRFRLSDYRGKVVVLTFSGNWCGPCQAMYPHERELVKRMKGRPFELLSVNTDEGKATLRRSLASGEITWRCWWEGGQERPNCIRWQQESFPMVYVIDSEGVIRAKDVRGKEIDAAVDPLVGQLESLTKATP